MALAPLKSVARQHPIVLFFVITFGFSWSFAGFLYALTGGDVFFAVGAPFAWGPLVGGVVTVWLRDENVRALIGQIRNWNVGVHWYLLGIGLVVLRSDFNPIVAFLLGADVGLEISGWVLYAALFNFFVTLLIAGSLEEFGWRGFAQVRLQRRYNAALVSVLIGIVWATWHLPYIIMGLGSFTHPINYVLLMIGTSVIYGWLYNTTNGALLVVMLAHAASNMPPFLQVSGDYPRLLEQLPVTPSVVFSLGVAIIVIWYAGSETLTRDGALPKIPGRSDQ